MRWRDSGRCYRDPVQPPVPVSDPTAPTDGTGTAPLDGLVRLGTRVLLIAAVSAVAMAAAIVLIVVIGGASLIALAAVPLVAAAVLFWALTAVLGVALRSAADAPSSARPVAPLSSGLGEVTDDDIAAARSLFGEGARTVPVDPSWRG